jgi:dihydrofolate reductase
MTPTSDAKREYSIVVAIEEGNGIGMLGGIPWALPGDMKYFKDLTMNTKDSTKVNAVIMGRKTYYSIPEQHRPLKGRLNMMITRHPDLYENELTPEQGTLVINSLDRALGFMDSPSVLSGRVESVFIIGGRSLYEEAMKSSRCTKIYITKVHESFDCDTFFPLLDGLNYKLSVPEWTIPIYCSNGLRYQHLVYERIN